MLQSLLSPPLLLPPFSVLFHTDLLFQNQIAAKVPPHPTWPEGSSSLLKGPQATLTSRHRVCGQRKFQNSRGLSAIHYPGQGPRCLLLSPIAADRTGLASPSPVPCPWLLFLSKAVLRPGPSWRSPKGPPKAKWTTAVRQSRLTAF